MTVAARPPAAGEEALPGLAVYAAAGADLERIAGAGDAAAATAAERLLIERLRKSVALDGVVAYHLMRPLSRALSRVLVGTRVTPNQVTLAAMGLGVAGAWIAAGGGYVRGLAAGLLFWLGCVVDCVDGEIARLRLEGSKAGEWLDIAADSVATLGLLVGIGFGLRAEGGSAAWPVLGLAGAAVGVVTTLKIHLDLHRMGLPVDSVYYPWAFHRPTKPGEARGAAAVAYLFRRDAHVTLVAMLCAAGLRRASFVLLLAGTATLALMLTVHLFLRGR